MKKLRLTYEDCLTPEAIRKRLRAEILQRKAESLELIRTFFASSGSHASTAGNLGREMLTVARRVNWRKRQIKRIEARLKNLT